MTICQNETTPESVGALSRGLTRLLDLSERGLAVKATRTCSVDGCERSLRARELCAAHLAERDPRPCSVAGCTRSYRAKGMCALHLARQLRHGDPTGGRVERGLRPEVCVLDGCERPHLARGYCSLHWQRDYKHGDLTRERSMPAGPGHHRWTGEAPTYFGLHQRVRSQRGAASQHLCDAGCGEQAAHWAYDHADPDELLDESGLRYSSNLAHYRPLCARCHSAFDRSGA